LLEEREKEEIKKTKAVSSGDTMKGNQSMTNSNDSLSQHTLLSDNSTSIDEQKVRDYQQSLLSNQQTSTVTTMLKSIEERKKEILQKFNIIDLSEMHQQVTTGKPKSDDKYTISSDSGIDSVKYSNLNSLSTRSSSIRQLNAAAASAVTMSNTDLLQMAVSSHQNVDDYQPNRPRVLDPLSVCTTTPLNARQMRLGLEFFDSRGSESRDFAIERLISARSSASSTPTNPMNQHNVGPHSQTNTSIDFASFSSNDDESYSFNKEPISKNTTDSEDIDEDTESASELLVSLLNSRNLKTIVGGGDAANEATGDYSLDFKRKLIQDQLDLVRAQKEQLLKSQQILSAQNFSVLSKAPFVPKVSSTLPVEFRHAICQPIDFFQKNKKVSNKPPVKSYKAVDCNPHELSTIREENNSTPLMNDAQQQQMHKKATTRSSMTDSCYSNDVLSSKKCFGFSSTSLIRHCQTNSFDHS
jgi:hypothetical protein